MSLYSYYCLKDHPNPKTVPKDYTELKNYPEKTYISEIDNWAYGEVGYIRVLTEIDEQKYGLLRK